MSGRATGWVLENGPLKRNQRAVLVAIADAADVNGENAHPGVADICSASLYGRSAVAAIITDLLAEGWLEITEQGGGRGRATEYRVPGVLRDLGPYHARKTVRKADGSKTETARSPKETARSEVETARSSRSKVAPTVSTTVEANDKIEELTLLPPSEPDPAEQTAGEATANGKVRPVDDLKARSRAIATAVHEQRAARGEPGIATFPAAMGVIGKMLVAGWADEKVQAACLAVPTISVGWLEGELRGKPRRPQGGPQPVGNWDRDEPSGVVKDGEW